MLWSQDSKHVALSAVGSKIEGGDRANCDSSNQAVYSWHLSSVQVTVRGFSQGSNPMPDQVSVPSVALALVRPSRARYPRLYGKLRHILPGRGGLAVSTGNCYGAALQLWRRRDDAFWRLGGTCCLSVGALGRMPLHKDRGGMYPRTAHVNGKAEKKKNTVQKGKKGKDNLRSRKRHVLPQSQTRHTSAQARRRLSVALVPNTQPPRVDTCLGGTEYVADVPKADVGSAAPEVCWIERRGRRLNSDFGCSVRHWNEEGDELAVSADAERAA